MRSATGFTLIEVMITVAIVAILAAVAIPSYTDYITRSKIQEATTTLLAQRTKMEQYFQDQRTYSGACDPLNPNTVAPVPTGLKYFTVSCPTRSTGRSWRRRTCGARHRTGDRRRGAAAPRRAGSDEGRTPPGSTTSGDRDAAHGP